MRDGDAHAQHASLATGAVEASARQPVTAGDIEQAKRRAAERAVQDHFDPRAKYVGIGSGTTILYVVEAIKQRIQSEGLRLDEILFVPTGYQSRQVILNAGLTPLLYDSLPDNVMLDVAFDGADEVDEDFNCVKGGGACLFQEKLVATRARKFICVAGKFSPAEPFVESRTVALWQRGADSGEWGNKTTGRIK